MPRDQLVLGHQPRRAMPPDRLAPIGKVAGHAWASLGVVPRRDGRPNRGHRGHVPLLAVTGGPFLPREAAVDFRRARETAELHCLAERVRAGIARTGEAE